MRFKRIENFSIGEILLDEGNYRFKKAENQRGCIEKIYSNNPSNFKNLMQSIAEDDLGELLLIYINENNEKIVLDGNRRAAAIKVLHEPELAPASTLERFAKKLLQQTSFNFDGIQAQVSNSKDLIYKTVYERHAAGKGKSRLNWTALASARFRFDQKEDEGQDWRATALIFEVEKEYPEFSGFIDTDYSHEVFRRIVHTAIQNNVISSDIFSERDMRIKKASKKLIKDAIDKAKSFLNHMEDKEISLSRGKGIYADKKGIEDFLSSYEKIPNNEEDKDFTNENFDANAKNADKPVSSSNLGVKGSSSNSQGRNNTTKSNSTKIKESKNIIKKLHQINNDKLLQLYKSLYTVSLIEHPSLIMVGAWSFYESLATALGKRADVSMTAFLNNKINSHTNDKGKKNSMKSSLNYIHNEGNCIKHGAEYYSLDAKPLINHFNVLEGFTVEMLDEIKNIQRKN